MRYQELNRKIFKIFVLSTAIIMLILIGLDIKGFVKAILKFNIIYVPIILALIILNYFFRYLKWKFYLSSADVKISFKDSIKIFLAAIPMTLTPGKIGEALKAYIIKVKYNYPITYTLPVVLVERITDALGMLILAGIGGLIFNFGAFLLGVVLLIVIGVVMCLLNNSLFRKIINILNFIPFLKRYVEPIMSFYENVCNLLNVKVLASGILIGIAAWIIEGGIVYFCIKGAGAQISFLYSIFMLALSSIIGVISMIPGGVAASEGSLLAMLLSAGIDSGRTGLIILLIRISTLWIGVVIGVIALMHVEKELKKSGFENFELQGEFIENK